MNAAIAATVVLIILIGLAQIDIVDELSPCSSFGFPGKCYSTSENICSNTWDDLESKCRTEVMKYPANQTPGRLLGKPIKQCQMVQYDMLFRYMRKSSSSECQMQFKLVDEYKRYYNSRL